MEERRIISVSELIKMFVSTSFLQEQRIFKFSDIYHYIDRCFEKGKEEGCQTDTLIDLIHEAEKTVEDLLNAGVISYVYPDGSWGMYHIEKVDYKELANHDKEYVSDMVKIFLDINGGAPKYVLLATTKNKQKK